MYYFDAFERCFSRVKCLKAQHRAGDPLSSLSLEFTFSSPAKLDPDLSITIRFGRALLAIDRAIKINSPAFDLDISFVHAPKIGDKLFA